jgi:NTE family protein
VKNARKALVLGGGGVTGIAWEIGLLTGLAELGVELGDADLVIGTSAGSVVGAQLTSGVDLEKLYADQLREPTGEIAANFSPLVAWKFVTAGLFARDDQAAAARIGHKSLATTYSVTEQDRLAVIEQRLPTHEWPAAHLQITAVDAETGELRVFERDSGVSLVQAVAASCAVPMVWPPVTIDGHRYVDGGARSVANADLARGCGRIVVLAPVTASPRRSGRIGNQLARLGGHFHSSVISPDAEARKARGRNPLDPAFRAAAARAGWEQAKAVRDDVGITWGSPPV